ncbi:MAG: N-acetyltransferase [Bacteroidia bacterium]|nr:N-acetyltransferase [Bacteroidia bacterium]MBT8269598.1 N-acetyltransferase [Bacteroidia bacterium]NNF82692.1 hypothetical protein [Flavobacteriaceae bacterium]NNK69137.1 hypothetical protein [Flavobacteriaceae bacterium]
MNQFEFKYYSSVDLIDDTIWSSLGCTDNIYYTADFLRAFENANSDIEFTYVVIFRGEKPIAFANTQIVTISVETITKNIKISSWLKGFVNNIFRNYHIRVMFCGNVFLSGEYGTFLCPGEDKLVAFKAIADAVSELASRTKPLNAIFVKDFKEESLFITDQLTDFDYTPMHVEPNMIIYLDPEWKNFDDFKTALKSKYRVKANKADSQSAALDVKWMNEQDILQYQTELQSLYENTIANANFNAQILNLDTYTFLKSTYGENFVVRGYFLEGRLVGFLSAMLNGQNLDAHFIGLNYDLNRQYAIYPRILNDYVRLGIAKGAKLINLGRTASEIKSTLGAIPEELTCYIRHKRHLPNKIMKPFIRSVKIKTFRQHQPFKQKKEANVAS